MLLILVLWVLIIIPGWSENWTQQQRTWQHRNGLAITLPADFQVEQSPQGILNVTGKQGFVNLLIQGMQGEKNYRGWLAGQKQTFAAQSMQVQPQYQRRLKSGLVANFLDSQRLSQQEILFVVRAAWLRQQDNYLCLQLYYPKQREKDWGPLLQTTLDSITPWRTP